jgi:drug/metabolite transporter (DMT)-like permease
LGGLLLASLTGLTLLRELLSWRYIAGMFLTTVGIYLIITRFLLTVFSGAGGEQDQETATVGMNAYQGQ